MKTPAFRALPDVLAVLSLAAATATHAGAAGHTDVTTVPRIPFMRGMGFDGYYESRNAPWMTQAGVYSGLAAKGFDHVRLPVDFRMYSSYDSGTGVATLNESSSPSFRTFDTVIGNAIDAGLAIILDFHGWFDIDPENVSSTNQFVALWKAVAERYKDYPNQLVFELANEPNSRNYGAVCAMQRNAITEIRKTNPTRLILLDPGDASQPWVLTQAVDPPKFSWVSLPANDNNIAVVVHEYNPGYFTHQGESWSGESSRTNVPFSDSYRATLKWDLNQCGLYKDGTGAKLVMNEFNASHAIATHSDVTDYLAMVTRWCESNNVPWAPWIYHSSFGASGFDCFSGTGAEASLYDFVEAGLFPDLVTTDKFSTNDYPHAIDIRFIGYSGASALADFPVLVRLSESLVGFSYGDFALPNGGDLRFTDDSGNLLPHEIDTWDTNGVSTVWVKVPSLTANAQVVARYGCSRPCVPKVESVWDGNYVGVWHMGESALPLKDSSNVSRDATSADGTGIGYGAAGIVGGAVDFGAAKSSCGVNMDDHRMLDGFDAITVEAWTRQDAHDTNAGILSKRAGAGNQMSYYMFDNGSGTTMSYSTNGSASVSAGVFPSPVLGSWNHQAYSLDTTTATSNSVGYLNGAAKGTKSVPCPGGLFAGAAELHIGNLQSGNAANFPGRIDEVRISKCVRSADWIKATHDTVAKANFARYAVDGVETPLDASLPDLRLKARTDKANPIDYVEGENIRFDFWLDGVDALPPEVRAKEPAYVVWTRTGDDGATVTGTNAISLAQGFSVTTSLAAPGIVRMQGTLVGSDYKAFEYYNANNEKKTIAFGGGAGVATEKLSPYAAEPDDFDAFWAEARAKLASVPLDGAELTPVFPATSSTNAYDFYAAKIPCFGPRPVTGWLVVPKNARPGSLSVKATFAGYGCATAVPTPPNWGVPGEIRFEVNAHGYDMVGHDDQYYRDFYDSINKVGRDVTYGLADSDYDNPTNTYFYYMALRVVRAFDYLKTRPEWDGTNIVATGGSQGGLQTMWAGGLVEGITKIEPSITWGCDIGCPRRGQTSLLSRNWGIPPVPGAYYFDSILHARRVPITCVAEIKRIGMGDYTCPPRGVLLSYYNLKCPVSAKLVQGSDHSYVPPDPNQTFTIGRSATLPVASEAEGCDWTNRLFTVSGLAAGDEVTLTITGGDDSSMRPQAAVADASGAVSFDVPTIPGALYRYSLSSGGETFASGSFLAGAWDADGTWFFARPDGLGGSIETNGTWAVPPAATNAACYATGHSAAFALSDEAWSAGTGRCVRAECAISFIDPTDVASAPALESLDDSLAAIAVATNSATGGEALWLGYFDGAWTNLFGSAPPVTGARYDVRLEGDFSIAAPRVRLSVSADGGASYAVLHAADGAEWFAPTDVRKRALARIEAEGASEIAGLRGELSNVFVAETGGVRYASLAAALRAAGRGGTVTLLTTATAPASLAADRAIVENGHRLVKYNDFFGTLISCQ